MRRGQWTRASWKRTAIAVLLGYALIIQALWSQAGLVRAAEAAAFDPMSALCAVASGRTDPTAPAAPEQPHGDLCCTLACAAAAAGMAGPAVLPAGAAVPAPGEAVRIVLRSPSRTFIETRLPRRFNARAPPRSDLLS
ncbi:hypothetical protein [Inquilinus sp.]|jgi:hypothetical protein|uniref:hypothetical protein n=1 Tax=Inquilinus sp. TaxID=1932117 RepID=UPI0037850028